MNKRGRYSDGMPRISGMPPIGKRSTDQYIDVQGGTARFDVLAYEFYGDASLGWIIEHAQRGAYSTTHVRVPLPLSSVRQELGI